MSATPVTPSLAAAGVAIAPMRWWHLPAVLALEEALFAPECWSLELFWSELAQRDTRVYLVMLEPAHNKQQPVDKQHAVDEQPAVIGYGGLAAYRDEAYIQTIGIAPSHQGRSLGALLLDVLTTEARARGAAQLGLEVRADNGVAQRLYGRAGFEVAGRRRGYYQPSGVDALVMLKDLTA